MQRFNRLICTIAVITSMTGLAAGCASIVSGTTQQLTFESSPAGAEVVIGGVVVGVTPVTVMVKRTKDLEVTVRKAGYSDHTFTPTSSLHPMFWGNLIVGGLIGSTTDGATGATVQYTPDRYYSTLQAKQASVEGAAESELIKFVIVNHARLSLDIARGTGDHLDALLTMAGVADRAGKIGALRSVLAKETELPRFAEGVATALRI